MAALVKLEEGERLPTAGAVPERADPMAGVAPDDPFSRPGEGRVILPP
jgi:hypothetical protein